MLPRQPFRPAMAGEIERRQAELRAMPEYRRMKLHRNIFIVASCSLAAWAILCAYLIIQLLERAL